MRDRKRDCCPRCGNQMRVLWGRERTVPGGTWYDVICPNCLHRVDYFKPNRRRRGV